MFSSNNDLGYYLYNEIFQTLKDGLLSKKDLHSSLDQGGDYHADDISWDIFFWE